MKSAPTALILAGGLGTRLRAVDSERPKPMVLVHGQPFLHWQVVQLLRYGFQDFIFSTGYKAEQIAAHPWAREFPQATFRFVSEATPLGTGGATLNVLRTYPELESCWVINGDTLLENPVAATAVAAPDRTLYVTLPSSDVFDAKPNLVVDASHVLEVSEQTGTVFDAGQVYLPRASVAEHLRGEIAPLSFAKMMQSEMARRRVLYTMTKGHCFDIGTPERLTRFATSEFFAKKS